MEELTKETTRIALKILSYLERNPSAMDTVKGISEWWIREDPSKVEEALAHLTKRNVVQISTLQGRFFYFLNRDLQSKPLRFEIEQMSSAGPGFAEELNGGRS